MPDTAEKGVPLSLLREKQGKDKKILISFQEEMISNGEQIGALNLKKINFGGIV